MQGDFSVLRFDPHENDRGVDPAALGVLRNLNGVLHQQGRVSTDADFTEGQLLGLEWQAQAGRDIVGAEVCAVPAGEPDAFRVVAAFVAGGQIHLRIHPGHAWADGLLTRLVGSAAAPVAPVERTATYLGPPIADPLPAVDSIGDSIRDAVILEVSQEALHGYQYPEALIEPALGGPDTSERAYVNLRLRLLRLADGEDCHDIAAKLRDDPSAKGHLSVSLDPVVAIAGDCPVVGGGGFTGFEHALYRIEIADTSPGDPPRFKWSPFNGGLCGRGRFDATVNPNRVILDAGRTAIITSGTASFYLEALQYDDLAGGWAVVYGSTATLNTDHDLELVSPPAFGALPATTDPIFIRLWHGIEDIASFTNPATPQALRDGIRLQFDAPAAGNYRPGDHWVFSVRAGEIGNPQTLIDHAPPVGIVYHRVPLAEVHWTARLNTDISGSIEDCRERFRPLVRQKVCCTLLVGDGVRSFGDFNSLEEAAVHLPDAGGELCLLPGLHRANLRLQGQRNVRIHGCPNRSLLIPRDETRVEPLLHFVDCVGVEVYDLDLLTYDGIAIRCDGTKDGDCRDLHLHDNRVVARISAIRAEGCGGLVIAGNRLHLLDTVDGRATVSVAADDVRIERNQLVLLPFVDPTPDQPDTPDNDPTRDPADPCARPQVLYRFPPLLRLYTQRIWTFVLALLVPQQPYRAIGGIHLRAGSERVRVLENRIVGGAGNGITLGGDLPGDEAPDAPDGPVGLRASRLDAAPPPPATVNVTGPFVALVQDEQGQPIADVDLYLESDVTASDRSDARGMASIKTAPGPYRLQAAPQYRIVRVAEARDEGVLVNAVTLAARDGAYTRRGFLHEVELVANDIGMMG